jgi:hypothetical protein
MNKKFEQHRRRWEPFKEGKADRLANRASRVSKYLRFSVEEKAYNEGWSAGEKRLTELALNWEKLA